VQFRVLIRKTVQPQHYNDTFIRHRANCVQQPTTNYSPKYCTVQAKMTKSLRHQLPLNVKTECAECELVLSACFFASQKPIEFAYKNKKEG
jgi:hypothetical protein